MSGGTKRCRQPAGTRLPRDVIASILVRLPAIELRRHCRVCKEWRDVISDPAFIKAHMVQGPRAPTHTVVFVPSSSRCGGRGCLFDEHWRLTARFTVGDSEVLIGTCNGLLCFHDQLKGVMKVVEPFTGESLAVPVPTDSSRWRVARSYCFGFDATRRQFKIVHRGKPCGQPYIPGVRHGQLQVFTFGADTECRTLRSIASCSSNSSDELPCNGGAMYWSYTDKVGLIPKYARLDLATEEITSVECRLVDRRPVFCHHPWWQRREPCIIGIRRLVGESDGGYWPSNMDAMALDVDAVSLPQGRRLPGPQALQRGHLLLQEENGDLYAHRIVSKSVHGLELLCEKLLSGIGVEEEPAAKRSPTGQFVPAQGSRPSWTQQDIISTFSYVPTVSPAPLALYLGTAMITALGALHVPPTAEKLHNLKHE
ncbi:F-box protein At2g17830-like [Aegilops tauschii subsp. strangulata]|uniref:F-box protein At2g17830-like n=1 Tax=Aegilops tauschii subsp. strangulata TaxID=200361 RepID=UPI000842FC9F|nr:uncharacterized protein LOC109778117 [Aegilops tauschii subsp. strangulata]